MGCTGMLVRAWRRESSQRRVKTWQHWRRTTRRLELRRPKARAKKKDMVTSSKVRAPHQAINILIVKSDHSVSSFLVIPFERIVTGYIMYSGRGVRTDKYSVNKELRLDR